MGITKVNTNTNTVTTAERIVLRRRRKPVRHERLIFDLKPMRRPISEEIIAWRLIFVIPNKARYNRLKGRYETSYHHRYWVYTEGDYNDGYILTNERFLKCLIDHNIDTDKLVAESDIAQALLAMAKDKLGRKI